MKQPLENPAELIDSYLKQNAPDGVAALSLGFPSAVDKTRRVLISTPAIPALDGADVVSALGARFLLPCVHEPGCGHAVHSCSPAAQPGNSAKHHVDHSTGWSTWNVIGAGLYALRFLLKEGF